MKWILTAVAVILLSLLTGCALMGRVLDGGGMAGQSYRQISQDEAKEMMARDDGHVVVDVRRQDEYDAGHIPGAILIPNESIGTERPEALPDLHQIILIYCRSGNRSKQAAQKLFDMGYTDIYEFGGINTWTGEIVAESGDLTVGGGISFEDITEFYYTIDASTYPPQFQRYRFHVEDEAHLFYHETRKGNHWPLTEADITVSGTKELSEEEWAAFLGFVKGGTVKKREESTESGGSGPWLYLYWKGDRSKYQEFTFATWNTQTAFEEFCVALAQEP